MKLRIDFVSNSSSCSFVIRSDQNYGIFRNNITELDWENYCSNDYRLEYDYRIFLEYDYGYLYWTDGTKSDLSDGHFTKQLSELISIIPDEEFSEFWLNSSTNDIERIYPESCRSILNELIPLCQEHALLNMDFNEKKNLTKRKKVCNQMYDCFKKLVETYKNVLTPKCKDMKFLITSCSDHEPGWSGFDDAESAMIYTLKNSKCTFRRIWNEH